MSKSKKSYPWLTNKPNSAKTLIEQAKREVPGFKAHYAKFEEQVTIGGYSSSTLYNYSRAKRSNQIISKHFIEPHRAYPEHRGQGSTESIMNHALSRLH